MTRPAIRRRPNASDTVDAALTPSSLTIDMDENGGASMTITLMLPEPSALTSAKLLDIANTTIYDYASTVPDFAHLDEESIRNSRAYVNARGTPIQQGFSEEEHRAIKIPNTFKDVINSPEARQWKAAIGKEKESLAKHKVQAGPNYQRSQGREDPRHKVRLKKRRPTEDFTARLVVQAHIQEPVIDNGMSYALVCRIGSVRTILAIACEQGWPVRHDRQGRVG